MPAWLSRITQAFVRDRRPPQETFSVECRCGERHQGIRTEQPQQLICPVCESRVFIFPRSVYPPVRSRSAGATTPAPQTVEVESMDQSVVPPGAAWGTRWKLWFRHLGRRWLVRLRTLFTPFRLVLAGMLLIIGLTGWWMLYRTGQDRAERTYLEQSELARSVIGQGDFASAETPLALAVAAADVLDEPAREEDLIRQLHREIVALSHLQTWTHWTMLREGEDILRMQGETAWQQYFELHFSSGWVVLQTELYATRTDEDQPLLKLDVPLILAGDPVEVRGVPVKLAEFLGDRDSCPVIVALQWKTCRREGDQWVLEAHPETLFLWSGQDTFEALGVTTEKAEQQRVQQLLQRQSEFLNLE